MRVTVVVAARADWWWPKSGHCPDSHQATHSMPSQQYLIVFAQTHENFRVPELLSVAEIYGFSLNIGIDFDPSRPFGILVLEQEEHVRLLARRCILIK